MPSHGELQSRPSADILHPARFMKWIFVATLLICLASQAQSHAALIAVYLQPINTTGDPIATVVKGQDFKVRVTVRDLTQSFDPFHGVFTTFVDFVYEPSLISLHPTTPVVFAPAFEIARSGDFSVPGLMAGVGAATEFPTPDLEQWLFDAQFHADQAGTVSFSATKSIGPFYEAYVFSRVGTPVLPSEMEIHGVTLLIEVPEGSTFCLASLGMCFFTIITRRRKPE